MPLGSHISLDRATLSRIDKLSVFKGMRFERPKARQVRPERVKSERVNFSDHYGVLNNKHFNMLTKKINTDLGMREYAIQLAQGEFRTAWVPEEANK